MTQQQFPLFSNFLARKDQELARFFQGELDFIPDENGNFTVGIQMGEQYYTKEQKERLFRIVAEFEAS